MTATYIVADNILSPIGVNTFENFERLKNGVSGIKEHDRNDLSALPFFASLFSDKLFITTGDKYTPFEQLVIASIKDALQESVVNIQDRKTLLIISTTKGNIGLLETGKNGAELQNRVALHKSAKLIAQYFGFVNEPIVVSNACISGIMAILTGMRLVQSGQYENVVVAGADVISKFILSGFQSFNAISPAPCKPFDLNRAGITLGEGAATMILSCRPKSDSLIKVLGGAVSNDANHISAPSRTGEELGFAMKKAMKMADLSPQKVDFISAHGTATDYNDEMEAKAIGLAGLDKVPANSLKGYYGHTLGAAGLIESIISIRSLKEGLVMPTPGFELSGTSKQINVNTALLSGNFQYCLKTASGFGGCNGAIVFGKN